MHLFCLVPRSEINIILKGTYLLRVIQELPFIFQIIGIPTIFLGKIRFNYRSEFQPAIYTQRKTYWGEVYLPKVIVYSLINSRIIY